LDDGPARQSYPLWGGGFKSLQLLHNGRHRHKRTRLDQQPAVGGVRGHFCLDRNPGRRIEREASASAPGQHHEGMTFRREPIQS